MKALLALVLLALAVSAQAQPRHYPQAELDALLAPIALYPDPLLSQVLIAATYPDDVREAAAWSRANAHLQGDEAIRAADPMPWDPSLKALLAYPDLLARMDESPQWTADLGAAFLSQEPQVMETVQTLRQRAQASGFLHSDGYHSVQQQDRYIVVQPLHSHIVYVPWYNPLVVYGPWWWHSHRPIAWRPWHSRPAAFVSFSFVRPSVDWHRHRIQRPVHVHRPIPVHRPAQVHRPTQVHRPAQVHRPVEVHRPQVRSEQRPAHIRNHVHPTQTARPIVQGAGIRPDFRKEQRSESRGQQRQHGRGDGNGRGRGRGRN
jgi:hypothetical protein